MKLEVLRRATVWCSRAAALGLLVGSVRFGWVATHWAEQRYDARESAPPESPERRRRAANEAPPGSPSAPPASGAGPSAPATAGPDSAQTAAPPQAPPVPPPPARDASYEVRTLWVDLGPPRSEVFVSGVLVGRTPYAGTWSCRRGDEVVIHVLPPGRGGVPLESRAACRDSMRAVAGRTLGAEEVAELLADPTLPTSVKDALRR